MRQDRGRWSGLAIGVPLGLVLGFLFVLGPLFTDGPASIADGERRVSFALTSLLFLMAATLLAWIAHGDWWPLGGLGFPGLAVAVWYASREPGIAGLAVVYVGLVAVAIVVGRILGLRIRRRRADVG